MSANQISSIIENVEKVIVGKPEAVRFAVAALLADSHMLIEDIPGVGKTTLARALALSVHGEFKRVQFTPDLLPSDLTGVTIYDQGRQEFVFRPGPVFTNFLLADEINRATPKSQAALLECMEERQVSVEGISHAVPSPFMVIATENPIEYEGTYSLPEAELDRFLLRVRLGYPSPQEEVLVLDSQQLRHPIETLGAVVSIEDLLHLQQETRQIYIDDSLKTYIVEIVGATRNHAEVELGASPRGGLALMRLGQALAAIEDRDYVIPDDIRKVAPPALGHRLMLAAERYGVSDRAEIIIHEILETHPAPLSRQGAPA